MDNSLYARNNLAYEQTDEAIFGFFGVSLNRL
jgi:hypothetical protein